jgi:tungstate transport system ATP-binding protein
MAVSGSILPLVLRDVCFAAGGRNIIDRVSTTIDAGPATIILGANGAGKSVLMRLMHGLLRPTSGEIAWREQGAERVRRGQAMVFQRPVMLRRSALANIIYFGTRAASDGGPARSRSARGGAQPGTRTFRR